MADTKKEHYVPRCYLENFASNSKRIEVFDKWKLMVRHNQDIKNVAMENGFYDLDLLDMLNRMDNMRTHHVKEVQTLLQGADMKLLYLPAYSPDLNPIENMWSKIKAILRKLKIRLLPQLPHGIAEAFSLIRPSDCAGWFSAAGIP